MTPAEFFARWLHPAGTATGPRPLVCKCTGLHDPRRDGTCRDCGRNVHPDDLICARVPTRGWPSSTFQPSEEQYR